MYFWDRLSPKFAKDTKEKTKVMLGDRINHKAVQARNHECGPQALDQLGRNAHEQAHETGLRMLCGMAG